MTKPRILIVDDEPQILRFLRPALLAGGYDVIAAATAAEARHMAATLAPDAVLLDLGLPDRDGKEVIRDIRSWSQVPIIVLSARDNEAEKIAALDLGADDYVNKPFGVGELLARIRASLRHAGQMDAAPVTVEAGPLLIDTARHQVLLNNEALHLTPKEFELLLLLMRSQGKVLTHRHILNAVWGPAHSEDIQYLRVLVGQLRHKIEANPAEPAFVVTEPGIGYRFSGG